MDGSEPERFSFHFTSKALAKRRGEFLVLGQGRGKALPLLDAQLELRHDKERENRGGTVRNKVTRQWLVSQTAVLMPNKHIDDARALLVGRSAVESHCFSGAFNANNANIKRAHVHTAPNLRSDSGGTKKTPTPSVVVHSRAVVAVGGSVGKGENLKKLGAAG